MLTLSVFIYASVFVSDVVFENGTISQYIQEALHILSLDENRIAFLPTLMNKDSRVTEIWFPGAHSDIGGGFWFDGLSDITLDFLLKEIMRRKLNLNICDVNKIDYSQLNASNGDYKIDYEDVFVKPNHKGKSHPKDRWWPIAKATLGQRDVRVNDNDEPSQNDSPVIHHIVAKRIEDVVEYRPRVLKGVKYDMLMSDGSTKSHVGLREHL